MNTPDTELEDNIKSALSSNPALRDKILALIPAKNSVVTEDTELHMKALAKSECAKDAGELTVVRLGYVVSLMKEVRDDRDTYWKEQIEKAVLKGERNRIIEQIREERDTYWKERVRKIYLEILRKARVTDYADTTEYDECAKLLKPLLDNLK